MSFTPEYFIKSVLSSCSAFLKSFYGLLNYSARNLFDKKKKEREEKAVEEEEMELGR